MHRNVSKKSKIKSQKYSAAGFSLVETMVAMAIFLIIGTAIISLLLAMISASNSAKLRNQGVGLAEEGTEQIRSYFQTNGFAALNGLANDKCYSEGTVPTPLGSCPLDPAVASLVPPNCLQGAVTGNSLFYRSIWLTRSGGAVKARSVATWTDRNTCRYTEVGTYFYSY